MWRAIVLIATAAFGAFAAGGARAAECPGNPNALGTSRVLAIDPHEFPRIGTMQYTRSLPLEDKEVVLTFDDGPLPPYTNRVLDVLAEHCVKANYFIIGRMARGYPDILKRIRAEGHTIGTHSENHLLAFDRMPLHAVQNEIEQGFASVGAALGDRKAVAPFFRIPGLLRAQQVEGYLQSRGIATWSADLAGDDWRHIAANEVVRRVMNRLEEKGRGVVLLHDIQPATALALPELLRELKGRGYRIVQVVPGTAADRAKVAARPPAPAPAKSEPPIAAKPEPPAADTLARAATPVRPAPAPVKPEPPVVATPQPPAPPLPAAAQAQAIAAPGNPPAPEIPPQASAQSAPAEAAAPAIETAAALPPQLPPTPPATMPEPTHDPRTAPDVASAAEATAKAEPDGDRRAAERTIPREPVRPFTPGLKPAQSFPTPGKASARQPWPSAVSVPLARAGGVGVSAIARTSQNDGRFQPER